MNEDITLLSISIIICMVPSRFLGSSTSMTATNPQSSPCEIKTEQAWPFLLYRWERREGGNCLGTPETKRQNEDSHVGPGPPGAMGMNGLFYQAG